MIFSNLAHLLARGLLCMAVAVPLPASSGQAKYNLPSIYAVDKVRLCNAKSVCKNITPTAELKKAIDEGYENLSLVDIYRDGDEKLVATSAGGCSKFFLFNRATQTFSPISFVGNGRDICNYKVEGRRLISSYKLDSKQYEDVYRIKDGAYQLIVSDGCVGCDQITRSVYHDGELSAKLLVTNETKYGKRRPIISSVRAEWAALYSAASDTSMTKLYLVEGDKVQLLDFDDSNGLWYLVRYVSKQNRSITKWVRCKDLTICN
ncbi:hypothetical protein [Paraburkholderia phenoliruptrix]|uniref:hypothetical protein n=1 Tax=Paraburkholderia phenoliruptrix TaxID=252970 RepID=UPI001C6ED3C8|nr:hypothetical protein [Paraburkholderia phenoliruptrix]MBW9107029.1 hypothetical protein [Paraburkholderia phenoliruptrix]MBW9129481.1 hypothetical protein [Paraburkholderia ginsengiterrae]